MGNMLICLTKELLVSYFKINDIKYYKINL